LEIVTYSWEKSIWTTTFIMERRWGGGGGGVLTHFNLLKNCVKYL
jgi:hypothetical protein